jgi:hypothetical protein
VCEEQDAAETSARGFPDFAGSLYCVVRRPYDRASAPNQSVHRHFFGRLTLEPRTIALYQLLHSLCDDLHG